jgi:hypothetical protein
MALEFLVQKLLWIGCGWGIIGWGVFRPALSKTIESIALVRGVLECWSYFSLAVTQISLLQKITQTPTLEHRYVQT